MGMLQIGYGAIRTIKKMLKMDKTIMLVEQNAMIGDG
jgi:hypothetical protein